MVSVKHPPPHCPLLPPRARPLRTQRPFPCHAAPHRQPHRAALPSRASTLSTGTPLSTLPVAAMADTTLPPPRRHQEEVTVGLDFISHGRKGRLAHAGLFVLDVLSRPKLAGYRSPQPSRPWLPAPLCLKCFRRFQLTF